MLKKLLGESAIYGISSIITKLIGIFLVPIYTQVFNPEDYGVVALTITTFSLLGMLVIFGFDSSAALYFYENKKEEYQKKPINNWLFSQLFFSFILAVIIIVFSSNLSKILFDNANFKNVLILSSLSLFFSTFTTVLQKWLRFQRKAVATVIITLTISLSNILLNIIFVLYLELGLNGVFLSNLSSAIIGFCICCVMMRNWISIAYLDRDLWKKMFKFALPLVPAALAYWLSNSSASYFLNFSLSKTEVGLFQIGTSISSGVLLFTGAFQMAISPFIFSQKDQPHIKQLINRVFIGYLTITSLVVLAISSFSYEILVLLTRESYYSAKTLVPILSLNFLLLGLNYIGSLGLNLVKNNKPYMVSVIIGAIINIGLFFLLIPILGKEGAAWSMTLSNICASILIFNFSVRYFPINFKYFIGIIIVVFSLCLGFILNTWIPEVFWRGILYKLIILVPFSLIIIKIALPTLKGQITTDSV